MSDRLSPEELRKIQKDLSKELGGELYFGNDDRLKLHKLPLGIPTFDAALDGGLAFDRMTLLYGQESAGKTLLAMLAIKAALEQDMSCVFIDVEKTWTNEWAEKLGIDPENVLVTRPRTVQEVFSQAIKFVRSKVGLIVIDSLAAMSSAAKLSKDVDEMYDKVQVGGNAAIINQGLADLNAENKGTLIIAINQVRENVGGYGNPEILPGGRGQRHAAWQRIKVKRAGWLEEGSGNNRKRIGFNMEIEVEKNKQGAPWKKAQVPFYYTGELDEVAGLIDYAVDMKVIRQESPHYYVPTPEGTEEKFFGRPKMIEFVKSREDVQALIQETVNSIEEVDI